MAPASNWTLDEAASNTSASASAEEGRGGEGRGFGNEMHVVKARQCFKSIKSNAVRRTHGQKEHDTMMSCPCGSTIEAVVCLAIRATDLVWDSCSSSVLDSNRDEIYGTSNLRGQLS